MSSEQLEMFAARPSRPAFEPMSLDGIMSYGLVRVRQLAASKPFLGSRRYEVNPGELLADVADLDEGEGAPFEALMIRWHGRASWGHVFRSLLRLQREGRVSAAERPDAWRRTAVPRGTAEGEKG